MILLIWLAAAIAAVYFYCRQVYSRFKGYGIKHKEPVPLLGNMGSIVLRQKHTVEFMSELYTEYPEERFVVRFEFTKPIIVIKDLELVKNIAIKDYEHFLDHGISVLKDIDPLFTRSLFALKGQEWKDMRSNLSPAFTSSKIRNMVPFIVEVGDQMMASLKKQLKESGKDYIDIDSKDIATRYTNDVIASCAFGLRVDSHSDPDNEFYKMGYITSSSTFRQIWIFFGHSVMPLIMKFLGITLFAKSTRDFFQNLVKGTMKDREERNILRQDMIHLLMEAKKGQLTYDEKTVKDDDAGFATVEESDVGKKTITREGLRRWPPFIATDRICIKDYNLGPPNGKSTRNYIMKAGDNVNIPIAAFHYDPQYFPDPLKFDPERFAEENKHKIQPHTYMPFGVGPRNCIGSRFALCEIKVMIYQLLLHMEVTPCEKTTIPAELARGTFGLRLKGGHHLRMKLRN